MQSLRKLSLIWAVVLLAAMLIPISDSRSLSLSAPKGQATSCCLSSQQGCAQHCQKSCCDTSKACCKQCGKDCCKQAKEKCEAACCKGH
jgi:hypothetical protein